MLKHDSTYIEPMPVALGLPHRGTRLIERTHLLARLKQGRSGRVLIVKAPSGYGKSQLLAAWSRSLRQEGIAVAWPALDDSVADPQYLVTALSNAVVKALRPGAAPFAIVPEVDGLHAAIKRLASLLNAARRPIVIILDDYDQVPGEDTDAILSELVRATQPEVHCVLVTRTHVKVPFGLLWFEGSVAELSQRDLRFSDAEIAELFEHRLSSEDLARISVWTEGWPVAVQLAKHYLGSRCGHVRELDRLLNQAHGDIGRYLTEQVVRHLNDDHRELLILSSFLGEFCIELIEAVTGVEAAWLILQKLEESNVLIAPIGENGGKGDVGWYRCHQLLRTVMFEQLCRRGRTNLVRLQRAASRWFAETGRLQDALHHAMAAGDTAFAAQLVLEAGGIFYCIRYGAPALRRLINQLPLDIVAHHPRLGLAEVAMLIKEGRIDAGKDLLRSLQPRCKAALALIPPDPLLARDLAMAELTSSFYSGEPPDPVAVATLEQATLDAPPDSFWLHGVLHNILCGALRRSADLAGALAAADTAQYYYALAHSSNGAGHIYMHLGMIMLEMANPTAALLQFQNSLDAFKGGQCEDTAGCALADLLSGQALYEQGRLAEARAVCVPALSTVENGEIHLDALVSGYQTLTALVAYEEGPQAALRVLARGLAFARRRRLVQLEQYLVVRRAALQHETESYAGLPSAIDTDLNALLWQDGRSTLWQVQELQDLAQAKLSLQRGEFAQAAAVLKQKQEQLGQGGRIRGQVNALVLLAGACEATGQRTRALEHIYAAVRLSMPGGLVMPFLEQGRLATSLLAQLVTATGPQAPDVAECVFMRRILRLGAAPGGLVASVFSFREREIVRLLVDGSSNKMIARSLEISPETVRFHLKNVYEKLGISDRRVVVVIVRERGLLD